MLVEPTNFAASGTVTRTAIDETKYSTCLCCQLPINHFTETSQGRLSNTIYTTTSTDRTIEDSNYRLRPLNAKEIRTSRKSWEYIVQQSYFEDLISQVEKRKKHCLQFQTNLYLDKFDLIREN